ncbi:MAG: MarR family transcriptional regulator [Myxococcales bacterium]|nr:MarR family transcriptional regulator [Myxococcales bacterium]
MADHFTDDGIVLERALGFRIYRINQMFRTAMYRTFATLGLDVTPEQWIVLVRLWQEDALTQTELAEATLKDKATISRILDVMEREGLIARRTDPDDARGRRIHATRKAMKLREKLTPLARELATNLEAGIPAADLECTRRVLLQLERNARALTE